MNRILLLLEHVENRRLLSEWLEIHYQVLLNDVPIRAGNAVPLLNEPFDLCILDGPALDYLWEWVQARKQAQQKVFLPFLLITFRSDVKMMTRQLWQNIDELITKPIERLELQARVEVLLRSRRLSLDLNATNEQLQNQIVQRQQAEAEKEKAYQALRESEARFRQLVEFNLIGIVLVDIKGNIIEANDALLKMVGYTREELLLGKVYWDKMTPPEYRHLDEQATEQLSLSGVCKPYEKEYIRKDGSRISILIGIVLLEETPSNCVCFVLDITDRKQAEAEIRNALQQEKELNELKSRFVSTVSHEFRNPLNVISSATQLLERYSEKLSQEKQFDLLRRIQVSVGRMTALLDDVLALGKAEAGIKFNPAPLDLDDFCHNLVEEIKLSTSGDRAIAFVIHGHCTRFVADESLLRHILTNLLVNAIKYSPAASTVRFELMCQDAAAIFQIEDKGIGIPLEDQKQLFEPFYRARNVGNIAGTGLGLALVRQCVDLYGGEIAVTSQVGLGTTFTVTLPLENCQLNH